MLLLTFLISFLDILYVLQSLYLSAVSLYLYFFPLIKSIFLILLQNYCGSALMFHLIFFVTLLSSSLSLINIKDEGALPHVDTIAAQFHNSDVIRNSIIKANLSLSDRTVKIPAGIFYSMPIVLHKIQNLTIILQGKLSASKNIIKWPKKPNSPKYQDFIYISDSSDVELRGSGKIDGRGYHWWMVQWLRLKKLRPLNSARPHMLNIQRCSRFKIHDLIMKNSPCFHLRIADSFDFDIYNLDIKVNTTAQFNLAKRFSVQGLVPLFPLNTDGIDPSGRNFHIWNISVQNYDDVVVPKPSHKGGDCDCTQNILVQNVTVRLGVGLSIGSVPPNSQHNCIRNVTFKNAYFQKPFKAIYIKTNPGNSGSGEIKHIYYYNMIINQPIWWGIYLGPQQQKQPLGGGPGCMLYPFDPRGTCQTQPRIDIRNITFENVEVKNSLLFPIVLRCNESNICTQINFKNVRVNKWFVGKRKTGYVCENVKGIQQNSYPSLDCLSKKQNVKKENQEISLSQTNGKNEYQQLNIKLIWEKIEEHTKSVPYFEEDDQMGLPQNVDELTNDNVELSEIIEQFFSKYE